MDSNVLIPTQTEYFAEPHLSYLTTKKNGILTYKQVHGEAYKRFSFLDLFLCMRQNKEKLPKPLWNTVQSNRQKQWGILLTFKLFYLTENQIFVIPSIHKIVPS